MSASRSRRSSPRTRSRSRANAAGKGNERHRRYLHPRATVTVDPCSFRGGRSAVSGNAHRHPHEPVRRRRRCCGVDLGDRGRAAATGGGRPAGGRGRAHGGGLARGTAPGDAGRRLGVAIVDSGAALSHRPRRRRGVGRRRPPGRLRGHARRRLPSRRTGGGRLPARRGRAGCGWAALARLGRSGRTPVRHALHELRRRRGRDQRLPLDAVRGHARAAFPRRCARRRALAGRAGGGPVLPGDRVLVALDGRSGPARRRTTESAWARRASCSSSTRSPTAPATRRSERTRARAPRGCGS